MSDPIADAFRARLERSKAATPMDTPQVASDALGLAPDRVAPDFGEELKTLLSTQSGGFDTFDLRAVGRTLALERAIGLHDEPWYEAIEQVTYSLPAGDNIVPITDDAWDRALLIARARAVLGYGSFVKDARMINAAEAGARLKALGYQLEATDGALHFVGDEMKRATADLLAYFEKLGAVGVIANLLRIVGERQGYVHDQYLIARRYYMGGASPPDLPVGFILNLAVRARMFAAEVTDAADVWAKAVVLALDIATLMDVQTHSQWALINVSPMRLANAISRLTLSDHIYGLRQWPAAFTPIAIAATFQTVDEELNTNLGWDGADAAALSAAIDAAAGSDPAIIDRAALFDVKTRKGQALMAAFTHERPAPNGGYDTPRAAKSADLMFKPLIGVDPSRVLLPARALAGPALFETALAAYRGLYPANKAPDIVGDAAERVFAELFTAAGLAPEINGNEYDLGGGDAGECDLVITSDDVILFVEIKAKPLTRAAMAGDDMRALLDFLNGVVRAQYQSMRHERILRQFGQITFTDGAVLEWRNRRIVRLSGLILDFGAIGERMVLRNLLEPISRIGIHYDSGHPEAKSINKLNETLKNFVAEQNALAGLGVKPGAPGSLASLSAGQLFVYLRDKPTLGRFAKRIAPYMTFMSYNPIFEFEQILKMEAQEAEADANA
jgi:hypothetical protein